MAEYWPAFTREVSRRLETGARVYGDGSFAKTPTALIEEVRQELRDVTGWSFVADTVLARIIETIEAIEDMIPGTCPKHPRYSPEKPPRVCCERCWMIYSVTRVQRDIVGLT
jgi:hypothetical protein